MKQEIIGLHEDIAHAHVLFLESLGYQVTKPKEVEQGKFSLGQWIAKENMIVRIVEISDEFITYDNLNALNKQDVIINSTFWRKEFKPATTDQIRKHLIGLAKDKYKKGNRVLDIATDSEWTLELEKFDYSLEEDSLIVDTMQRGFTICIYKAGIWAEILQPAKRSVWELIYGTEISRVKVQDQARFRAGKTTHVDAYWMLTKAIDKHNEATVWDSDKGYYYLYVDVQGNVDFKWSEDIISPFRIHGHELAESFLALEHSTDLLKIALRINQ